MMRGSIGKCVVGHWIVTCSPISPAFLIDNLQCAYCTKNKEKE
jgi:hypothetical protein